MRPAATINVSLLRGTVMNAILALFCGCRHRNQSRPISIQGETYMVCLDCGRHIEYTGVEFKIGKQAQNQSPSTHRRAGGAGSESR